MYMIFLDKNREALQGVEVNRGCKYVFSLKNAMPYFTIKSAPCGQFYISQAYISQALYTSLYKSISSKTITEFKIHVRGVASTPTNI